MQSSARRAAFAGLAALAGCATQPVARPPDAPERYAYPIAGLADQRPRIPVFSADGKLLIFNMGEPSQIYISHHGNGQWSAPQRAGFSDTGANFEPFLLPDQRTLLFGSTRPPGREPGSPRVWRTVLQPDGSWSAPELALSTDSDTGLWYANGPSPQQIYFSGELPGQLGKSDLWIADLTRPATPPVPLPEPLNSPHIEWDPYLLPGGSGLLFASGRPGGAGGVDLYVAFRTADGSWGQPRNLGPAINSERNEVATAISPDGETLFFIREPSELFWVSTQVIYSLRTPP